MSWLLTRRFLHAAGARAVRLRPSRPAAAAPLHGLIVGGGADVDPRLYGVGEVGPGVDPRRDAFELAALARADREELPVLGICRGAQLLNVWAGGSLHAEVSLLTRRRSRRLLLPLVDIEVEPGTVLARTLGRTALRVNALHHQSVARTGKGLAVAARSRDGIVQAIEDRAHPFRVGVQWHPELLPRSTVQLRLFAGLASAARARLSREPVVRSARPRVRG